MQPPQGLWASSGEKQHGINYGKLEGEPELPNVCYTAPIPVYSVWLFKK